MFKVYMDSKNEAGMIILISSASYAYLLLTFKCEK